MKVGVKEMAFATIDRIPWSKTTERHGGKRLAVNGLVHRQHRRHSFFSAIEGEIKN